MTRLALILAATLSLGCAFNAALPPCLAVGDAYCERETCNADGTCTTDRTRGANMSAVFGSVLRPFTETLAVLSRLLVPFTPAPAPRPVFVPECAPEATLEPLGRE